MQIYRMHRLHDFLLDWIYNETMKRISLIFLLTLCSVVVCGEHKFHFYMYNMPNTHYNNTNTFT